MSGNKIVIDARGLSGRKLRWGRCYRRASQMALVKNPPAKQEMQVKLGFDSLEKKMVNTLAWRIPLTEESGGLQPMES